jgi:hypothetical protein
MLFTDVVYMGGATVLVMALLHVALYVAVRILYPPEPKVIYVPAPAPQQQQMVAPLPPPLFPPATTAIPPPQIPPQFIQPPPPQQPAFTESKEEVQLPEYEPRSTPSSTSLRLDTGIPDGLQETRPPGT